MPEKTITLTLAVPLGHRFGDYCQVHANNGSGEINYDTPFLAKKIPLFPNGSGNYGFGLGPFGKVPFGKPYAKNIKRGFGTQPFGRSPFGIGTVVIKETLRITECGDWKFALVCYDKLGNVNQPTPAESTVTVHVEPPKAQGLEKKSYDKETDILVLAVIDPFSLSHQMGNLPSRIMDLTGSPFEGLEDRIADQTSSPTDPDLPSRSNA